MSVDVHGISICVPQGNTGLVMFTVEGAELTDEDRGIFTVVRRDGVPLLRKILPPGESENAFLLPFTYEDTATLKPDIYNWSFRVVSEGAFDEKGHLMDAVHHCTAVPNGILNVQEVTGGTR